MTIYNFNIHQLILKYGTTAVLIDYVGPLGEIAYDTTIDTIRIMDGVTPGGIILPTNVAVEHFANVRSEYWSSHYANTKFANLTNAITNSSSNVATLQSNITSLVGNNALYSNNLANLQVIWQSLNFNTSLANTVITAINGLTANLLIEEARAIIAENSIRANIQLASINTMNATNAINAAISTFNVDIGNETAQRMSNNVILQTNINNVAANIGLEAVLRASGDAVLQSNILSLNTARIADIQSLQGNITASNLKIADLENKKWFLANGFNEVRLTSNGNVIFPGSILPSISQVYDLGSPDVRFKGLYVSENTIFLGDNEISVDPTVGLRVLKFGNPVPFFGNLRLPDGSLQTTAFLTSYITNEANARIADIQSLQGNITASNLKIADLENKKWFLANGFNEIRLTSNGNVIFPGSILPRISQVYDLGSPDVRFKGLYLSENTIFLGDNEVSVDPTVGLRVLKFGHPVPFFGNFRFPDGSLQTTAFLTSYITNEANARIADIQSLYGSLQGNITASNLKIADLENKKWFLANGFNEVRLTSNGNVIFPGSILPSISQVYDLGSPDVRFKGLYVSENTIFLGDNEVSVDPTVGLRVLKFGQPVPFFGNLRLPDGSLQTTAFLTSYITNEANARTASINMLYSNIADIQTQVDDVVDSFLNALISAGSSTGNLVGLIGSLSTSLNTALNAEISRAQTAEATIDANMTLMNASIQTSLTIESATRGLADIGLDAAITGSNVRILALENGLTNSNIRVSSLESNSIAINVNLSSTAFSINSNLAATAFSINTEFQSNDSAINANIATVTFEINSNLAATAFSINSNLAATAFSINTEFQSNDSAINANIATVTFEINSNLAATAFSINSNLAATAFSINTEFQSNDSAINANIATVTFEINSNLAATAFSINSNLAATAFSINSNLAATAFSINSNLAATAFAINSNLGITAFAINSSLIAANTSQAAADTAINSLIANLISGLTSTNITLAANVATLNSRIDFIITNANVGAIDSLSELLTAMNNSDNTLLGAINNKLDSATYNAGIAFEELKRENATNSVNTRVLTLETSVSSISLAINTAYAAADTSINASISSANTAYAAADTAINTAYQAATLAINTAYTAADTSINASISSANTAYAAADTAINTAYQAATLAINTAYTAADTSINASISSANTAYAAADTAINTAYQAATLAINTAYTAADTSINASISSANTAYAAADTSINASISSANTAYAAADTAINTAYAAADTAINTAYQAATLAINTAYTAADTAINTAYAAADTSINASISSANTAYAAADTAINTAYAAADTSINASISSANTAYAAADTAINTAYAAADTAINTAYQAATLAINTAYAAADTSINAGISSANTAYAAADTAINTAYQAATLAINTAYAAADTSINAGISSANTAYAAADTAINLKIVSLETTVAYRANNLSVFAATTSTELRNLINDETGTGNLVFSTGPTLVTPNLGAALANTISISDTITMTPLNAVPSTPVSGMLAVANGTGWNPTGTGAEALVVYLGGNWKLVANA